MEKIDAGLNDRKGYLERMSKALYEKLRVLEYIPEDVKRILDVGCADGSITRPIARLRPGAHVKGVDISDDFIKTANEGERVENATFDKAWLSDLHDRPERYDCITFISVLHEFFHYEKGITSVLKAVCDAYELLEPGGKIVIRDMILPEGMKEPSTAMRDIADTVRAKEGMDSLMKDFEKAHGPIDTLYQLNHFLLKYMYTDNWERECKENYVPVTSEQYMSLFKLLGAEVEISKTYLLPFLREKWRDDFGLSEEQLKNFLSTTILVIKKPENAPRT